jgi:hypothetical protein
MDQSQRLRSRIILPANFELKSLQFHMTLPENGSFIRLTTSESDIFDGMAQVAGRHGSFDLHCKASMTTGMVHLLIKSEKRLLAQSRSRLEISMS